MGMYGSEQMYILIDDIMRYLETYHKDEIDEETRDNLENYVFFKGAYCDLVDYISEDNNGEIGILLGQIRDYQKKEQKYGRF